MVCKDLDVATEVSRASDLNCVTMDGDQRDKKGTLTGGFIDSSRSRLAAMRAIKVLPCRGLRRCRSLRCQVRVRARNGRFAAWRVERKSSTPRPTRPAAQ